MNPINILGKQIKGAFTLSFSSRGGRPMLFKPLLKEWGTQSSVPSTEGSVDHGSLRVMEVRSMEEEGLSIMSSKASVRTRLVDVITESGQLLAGGSDDHCCIGKGGCDLGRNDSGSLMKGNPCLGNFI